MALAAGKIARDATFYKAATLAQVHRAGSGTALFGAAIWF
jgi:hypothetical protein